MCIIIRVSGRVESTAGSITSLIIDPGFHIVTTAGLANRFVELENTNELLKVVEITLQMLTLHVSAEFIGRVRAGVYTACTK